VRVIDLTNEAAKEFFLKGTSYFNNELPEYIGFDTILKEVATLLPESYVGRNIDFKNNNKASKPACFSEVNYTLVTNKDGRFAWRPLQLIHPAIYVSLVNEICTPDNWSTICNCFKEFQKGIVNCCSIPVVSTSNKKDVGEQIHEWWEEVEQESLKYSLEYSYLLHTDVTDCYGSLYTHSIPWAIHGMEEGKKNRKDSLLGNRIDSFIRDGRYGQTNGISQGSVLMDFIAEIVLGFIDGEINKEINEKFENKIDFKILRYRDDYRIFANSKERLETILKTISDKLRLVGMKLNTAKTISSSNVIEGSIKPYKLAEFNLGDLEHENAKTIQKQFLRLHSFGQKFQNSGALKKLLTKFYEKIKNTEYEYKVKKIKKDLEVLVAIVTDIGFVSPDTFHVVAAILNHLILLAESNDRISLCEKVQKKMRRLPNCGHVEIWLQRVVTNLLDKNQFNCDEPICKIAKGDKGITLWNNDWISCDKLQNALDTSSICIIPIEEASKTIELEEISPFSY
jgi:RNA-directed DNA polymerase